jgi:hypothetical protein
MTAHTYARTSKNASGFSGQKGQVWAAMAQPGTVAEIAERLKRNPKFSTVQTPERIAAYYVCVLKKSGHVEITAESEPVGIVTETEWNALKSEA